MSRLVIVAPNWLGDAVMALPAIADLRRALPEVTIAVAAKPAVASLFGMVRDVDEIIEKGAARLAGRHRAAAAEFVPLGAGPRPGRHSPTLGLSNRLSRTRC